MADEKRVVMLDDFEQRLMVNGLTDFRNDLLREDKPTEDLDDLILKVIDAPTKKENGGQSVRQDKFSRSRLILYACGVIPVVWFALLLAPYFGDGLVGLIRNGGAAFNAPFHITICEDSVKTVLLFFCAMAWASESIFPPTAITDDGRNTVRQNGAFRALSTGSTRIRTRRRIKSSRRMWPSVWTAENTDAI